MVKHIVLFQLAPDMDPALTKLLEAGTFGKPGSFNNNNICEGIEWRDLVMIVEGIIESGDSRKNRLESLRKLRK